MAEGGILTGKAICEAVASGLITITPWAPAQLNEKDWSDHRYVNAGSYDLLLGDYVAVYRRVVYFIHHRVKALFGSEAASYYDTETKVGNSEDHAIFDGSAIYADPTGVLDSKKKNEVYKFRMNPETGWLCKPGIGYLMHTRERIATNHYEPVIDGKSSMGRLFTTAHVTAGYGDPGFNGQYTLEVTVTHPTIIYPGMRFCQMRFHTLVGEHMSYDSKEHSHYTGEQAVGPVPSMAWKQIEEEFACRDKGL